jgi:predicted enzyme related to lactoylglutathione lyase
MFTKPADMPMPPNWLYYIRVPNADEAVERVKALGGQVLNGPMDVPGGDRIAQCLDPQGAAFAVHARPGRAD